MHNKMCNVILGGGGKTIQESSVASITIIAITIIMQKNIILQHR